MKHLIKKTSWRGFWHSPPRSRSGKLFRRFSPAQLTVFGFVSAAFLGSLFLLIPGMTHSGISFIDALFTSTSAVCVTGLTVLDTGKDFTFAGQMVILLLIQLGGLGIMTASTLLMQVVLGRSPVAGEIALRDSYGTVVEIKFSRFILWIFLTTMAIELLGALLLYYEFSSLGVSSPLWSSIFHSVSAFCNAGFSLYSNSLERFSDNYGVLLIFASLIITGGIGFIVIYELLHRRLSLHSKVVLLTTAFLIFAGTIFFFVLERNNTLKGMDPGRALLNSLFEAVTPRTAGFNSIPTSALRVPTLFLLFFLMVIGASPGGTGGGVKTTTFALLVLSFAAFVRRRRQVRILGRAVNEWDVFKAHVVFISYVIFFTLSSFILLLVENIAPYKLFFEVASALGTVGLSTGITSSLSPFSKLVLVVTMLAGRVGPLTLAASLASEKLSVVEYPYEGVFVG